MLDPAMAFPIQKDNEFYLSPVQSTDNDIRMHDVMWFQHKHDQTYHHDIAVLPLMRRLSHLNHHLVKYIGRIQKFKVVGADVTKEITDSLICCISAISVLAIHTDGKSVIDFYMMGRELTEMELSMEIGRVSKAIEGFDHLESIDYRGELNEAWTNLFATFLAMYYRSGGTKFIANSYYPRLIEIKERHPFHKYFVEEGKTPTRIEGL